MTNIAIMNENNDLIQGGEIELLQKKISQLNNICNTLNPYGPISTPMQEELSQFGIDDIDNPFTVTNKLILLLENSVDDLNKLIDEQKIH